MRVARDVEVATIKEKVVVPSRVTVRLTDAVRLTRPRTLAPVLPRALLS